MSEQEYIKTYAIAMFMLTFLDEWSEVEKIGVIAKIFNIITKKHNVFHSQILDYSENRRKKISKKTTLFVMAEKIAIRSYEKAFKNKKSSRTIMINTTVHYLYNLNKENFDRLYGINEEVFKKFDNKKHTHVLHSCGAATILNKTLEEEIKIQFKKSEDGNK